MQPLPNAKSFHEADVANDSMNLFELLVFLRDFKVIPRLITKKDVKEIWTMIGKEWIQSGRGTLRQLDVESFKDAFVRLAIVAYSKHGISTLTKKVTGGNLMHSEMVTALCNYLNLYDEVCVKDYIREVGRKTQGLLNFRSKDEDDHKRRSDFNQDRAIHRMQITAHRRHKKQPPKLPPTQKNRNRRSGDDEFHSYLPPVLQQRLYPEREIKVSEEEMHAYLLSCNTDSQDSKLALLGEDSSSVVSGATQNNSERLDGYEPDPAVDKIFEGVESDDDASDLTEGSSRGHGGHIPADVVLQSYEKGLVRFVAPYFHNAPDDHNDHIMHSEGSFLDMGRLPVGANCLIKIHVTNRSADELAIDVTTRGFEADNIKVTTFPKLMVSGLSRYIGVSFGIAPGNRSVIGYVDIHTYCSHNKKTQVMSVPVFYKVGPHQPTDKLHPLCTIRTLSQLLLDHLGSNQRSQRVEFATRTGFWNGTSTIQSMPKEVSTARPATSSRLLPPSSTSLDKRPSGSFLGGVSRSSSIGVTGQGEYSSVGTTTRENGYVSSTKPPQGLVTVTGSVSSLKILVRPKSS